MKIDNFPKYVQCWAQILLEISQYSLVRWNRTAVRNTLCVIALRYWFFESECCVSSNECTANPFRMCLVVTKGRILSNFKSIFGFSIENIWVSLISFFNCKRYFCSILSIFQNSFLKILNEKICTHLYRQIL